MSKQKQRNPSNFFKEKAYTGLDFLQRGLQQFIILHGQLFSPCQ